MKSLLIFTTACLFVGALCGETPESGPYEVKLSSIEKCNDPGKELYSMDMKYNQEKDTWDGVGNCQGEVGDNVMVNIDVQRLEGGEWKKEFTQNVGGVCSLIKAAPDAVEGFMKAMDLKECPIKEGSYTIKDLPNSFVMPFIKEATYGDRKADISFLDKDGNILGCFSMLGKVVPKPE